MLFTDEHLPGIPITFYVKWRKLKLFSWWFVEINIKEIMKFSIIIDTSILFLKFFKKLNFLYYIIEFNFIFETEKICELIVILHVRS